MEEGDRQEGSRIDEGCEEDNGEDGWKNGEWWISREEEMKWNVKGETVLELGAGALG